MKILILVLWLFTQCRTMNYPCENIKNGLYYGQNKGFFPQTSVFVLIKDSVAFAEGFYPLKGMLFITFTDTLYYSAEKNIFNNEKSFIYIENNKLYFEREDSLWAFRVEKVKLMCEQDNGSKYDSFKEKAVPYYPFWNQE
ncbi:MAG: hypothetical protein PHI54_04845 [Bacteroidales bacterium]|nr:hypothetical protein [Bacteroidales bacterium]MDD4089766.1 hypothetical protein [Tissierellia bacterium]